MIFVIEVLKNSRLFGAKVGFSVEASSLQLRALSLYSALPKDWTQVTTEPVASAELPRGPVDGPCFRAGSASSESW